MLCRRYRLAVKDKLQEGANLITITFMPASTYARVKAGEYPYAVPMQPVRLPPLSVRGDSHC